MKVPKPKGSSVCIAVMFVGWVAYVLWLSLFYAKEGVWLPESITLGTIGLFLVETVSLARLKMAKEGNPIKNKIANPILKKLGVDLPDFEEEVQEIAQTTSKEITDGNEKQADQP